MAQKRTRLQITGYLQSVAFSVVIDRTETIQIDDLGHVVKVGMVRNDLKTMVHVLKQATAHPLKVSDPFRLAVITGDEKSPGAARLDEQAGHVQGATAGRCCTGAAGAAGAGR